MTNLLKPESPFPNTEDVSEVCAHAFQTAAALFADGHEGMIRIIAGKETIGRLTSDRRPILITRDQVDAAEPSDELYEVEILKPDYRVVEDPDTPDAYLEQRLVIARDNPYEFFVIDEDGSRVPLGRGASKRLAERIAYSNIMEVPAV